MAEPYHYPTKGDLLILDENLVARFQPLDLGSGLSFVNGALTVTPTPGGGTYQGASPSNITVGGIPAGTAILGMTYDALWEMLLITYLSPSFSSFNMSGQSTIIECGNSVSGTKTFTWGTTYSGNVQANSVAIQDVTGGTDLATGLANDGTEAVAIVTATRTSPGSYSWRAQATDTNSVVFNSGDFTVVWYFRICIGTSANATLTEAQIEALSTQSLNASFSGTYALAAGDYKYFSWPDSYGSPTAATGFKDTSTGFPVSMADAADNAAYSNVQNGWNYALVSVTNTFGVTVNYRVYRSKNLLGGSLNVQIS